MIDFIKTLIFHLDQVILMHLSALGLWAYGIFFAIIFLETGLFLTPFLPGESLLFTLGALAARQMISLKIVALSLTLAAILGGFLNYFLGYFIGLKIINSQNPRLKIYLKRTHDFYERHGVLTILLARLVPVVRTYAPFIAGISRMSFVHYSLMNIIGGIIWINAFLWLSYGFGNEPLVQQHFSAILMGIITVSVVPVLIELIQSMRKAPFNEKS